MEFESGVIGELSLELKEKFSTGSMDLGSHQHKDDSESHVTK